MWSKFIVWINVVLMYCLNGHSLQVKIGIMQNFTSFLRVCTPETRMCYLTEIDKIMAVENNNNWRLRSIFALYVIYSIYYYVLVQGIGERWQSQPLLYLLIWYVLPQIRQVCELCDLFPSQVCAEYLVEPAFMLAKDDVACVREYSQFAVCKSSTFNILCIEEFICALLILWLLLLFSYIYIYMTMKFTILWVSYPAHVLHRWQSLCSPFITLVIKCLPKSFLNISVKNLPKVICGFTDKRMEHIYLSF